MPPVIGITPASLTERLTHGNSERISVSRNYIQAVLSAGGLPIIVPAQLGHADAILDLIDGVLLSGGSDLDPALFGDTEVHPKTYGVDPLRDQFEIELARGAIARDLPLLGICRGIQVLNVALGGTLYQDIPDQIGHQISHQQRETGLDPSEPSHQVTINPNSKLAALTGSTSLEVNSFHHQVVRDVAPSVAAVARTSDGLVEAVELPERAFAVAVQWHPEMMFERHPEQLALFAALVTAANAAKLTSSNLT